MVFGLIGWLVWPTPGQAQVSFEVGSDPGASHLGAILLDSFQRSDPPLLIAYSSHMNEEDIDFALRMGLLDLALITSTVSDHKRLVEGMNINGAGLCMPGPAGAFCCLHLGSLIIIVPQSPSPEARRFIDYVQSLSF